MLTAPGVEPKPKMANFYAHVALTNPTKAGHARKPLKSPKTTNRVKSLKTTKVGDLAISALKTPGWLVLEAGALYYEQEQE